MWLYLYRITSARAPEFKTDREAGEKRSAWDAIRIPHRETGAGSHPVKGRPRKK
jgi:hypothetical protein